MIAVAMKGKMHVACRIEIRMTALLVAGALPVEPSGVFGAQYVLNCGYTFIPDSPTSDDSHQYHVGESCTFIPVLTLLPSRVKPYLCPVRRTKATKLRVLVGSCFLSQIVLLRFVA